MELQRIADLEHIADLKMFKRCQGHLQSDAPKVLCLQGWSMVNRHLGPGGAMMTSQAYTSQFGTVTKEDFFGDDIWAGLHRFIQEYWQKVHCKGSVNVMQAPPGSLVPWFGVFQTPLNFSRNDAISVGAQIGHSQYPAIFYVPAGAHYEMMQKPSPHCSLSDLKSMRLTQFNPHTGQHGVYTVCVHSGGSSSHSDGRASSPYMETLLTFFTNQGMTFPPGTRLIEVHCTPLSDIITVCLKIAVGNSNPWWVNSRFVRLLCPMSLL
jgi:hypothetical protein